MNKRLWLYNAAMLLPTLFIRVPILGFLQLWVSLGRVAQRIGNAIRLPGLARNDSELPKWVRKRE